MEERLKTYLRPGEQVRWQGRPAPFSLLEAEAKKQILLKWGLTVALGGGLLAVYLSGTEAPSMGFIGLVLLAVDELDIGKVEVGQEVRITADALEGQTFSGVVDKVSINGTTANGATSYPVTIIIEDYGDLRPGMNVSAQIIGEVVPNALCIPVDAVERGNTVTVPGPGALSEDGLSVVDVTKLETKEVTLGRNDDEYIEVTDGLEEGDVVLISNQASSLMDMMMGG